MNEFLRRMFMTFNPTIEGDSDGGTGDGGVEANVIKFGGVEVDTTGMTEAQIESLTKAHGSYKSSSERAIELDKKVKAFEKNPPNQEQSKGLDETKIAEIVKAVLGNELKPFQAAATKAQDLNLKRGIEDINKTMRTEYNMIADDVYNAALAEAKEVFDKQEPGYRNENVYNNILKDKLGDKLRSNITSIQDDLILKRMESNPELQKQFIEKYAKNMGIQIKLPSGGFTNEVEFKGRMDQLKENFQKSRNDEERKTIAKEIAEVSREGSKYGFTY